MSTAAYELAMAHKNKGWARRWLRAHKKPLVEVSETERLAAKRAAKKIIGISVMVKGARVSR